MNTTKQLADALRDAILCVAPDQNPETFKCAREALAAYDAQTAGVVEPNGKLVGWWNGIMPDVTERSPYGPSVRWGADAEDSAHDIPLYDGYNPIRFTKPILPSVEAFASAVWRDWMTNEQADKLGAELHAWLRAHIAAAPAASGVDTSTNEAWVERAQEKIAAMDSASGGESTNSLVSSVEAAMHACYMDHDDYRLTTTLLHDMAIAAVKVVATTPQPSADAVRELVKRWRELSVKSHRDGQYQGYDTLRLCADELESLLSAASGEGVGGG